MSVLLEKNLEILKPYLRKKDIVEICINQPGKAWLEKTTGEWVVKKDKNLTLSKLLSMTKLLAENSGQDFNEEYPMLSMAIPGYGYRLQVISGSAVDSGFSLSIRLGTAQDLPLSSWFNKDQVLKLKQLIEDRKTILVSGGTGSGKTTLLNALIKYIDNKDRIITLEDSKELVVNQPNNVRLLKSKTGTDVAKLGYKEYINTIMRFRPDRILLGEIDMENAFGFFKLLNTGHDGLFSTIHANSPKAAIEALTLNCVFNGVDGDFELIENYLKTHISTVIQVKRIVNNGKREFKAEFVNTNEL
jgi:type IV secretion system protein VirB11